MSICPVNHAGFLAEDDWGGFLYAAIAAQTDCPHA